MPSRAPCSDLQGSADKAGGVIGRWAFDAGIAPRASDNWFWPRRQGRRKRARLKCARGAWACSWGVRRARVFWDEQRGGRSVRKVAPLRDTRQHPGGGQGLWASRRGALRWARCQISGHSRFLLLLPGPGSCLGLRPSASGSVGPPSSGGSCLFFSPCA